MAKNQESRSTPTKWVGFEPGRSMKVDRFGLIIPGQLGNSFFDFLEKGDCFGTLIFFVADVADAYQSAENQVSPS
jgi:hypothetical protein